MVRFNVQQSVWKNSEDEILKAAVMKYGLNQWGRVASLFAKRSARECKARWYEWLDPNIKKTEWSREEDEKLMHLAKLMPTQWRTIAPLVGRTAAQCLERYEQLLDEAVGGALQTEREDEEEGEEGEESTYPKSKKRTAAAETLPAKPDAQDMDEEELEMLSEAKARLANTLGKKAKRKARERQLEEQKKIALFQKRRELKAAGIRQRGLDVVDNRKRRRKNSDAQHIDYTEEVPFEQLAPTGPYDVGTEKAETIRRERDERARIEKLAAAQAQEAKKASEKRQKKKSTTLGVKDLEARLANERRKNEEALAVARGARAPLDLPAPQMPETELEEVAKVSASFAVPPLPSSTRVRGDIIAQEAKNQLARDGVAGLRVEGQGTGWRGEAGAASDVRKALPSLASRRTFAGANGRLVVLRDELGINREMDEEEASTVVNDAEELAEGSIRGLQSALKSLPAPEYEYSIEPKKRSNKALQEERDDPAFQGPEDARENERKRLRMMQERQRQIRASQPSAVKRELPDLPLAGVRALVKQMQQDVEPARAVILQEMLRGLEAGDAKSISVESCPELADVYAGWDESKIHWDRLFGVANQENPLEQFSAGAIYNGAKLAAAKVAKENAQVSALAEEQLRKERKRCEALAQEVMTLYKQQRKVEGELDMLKWIVASEAESLTARLEKSRFEMEDISAKEAALQRLYLERMQEGAAK